MHNVNENKFIFINEKIDIQNFSNYPVLTIFVLVDTSYFGKKCKMSTLDFWLFSNKHLGVSI